MKCQDCYFWHKELGFCCLKSSNGYQDNAEDCPDAIFDLVWDEEKQEAVLRRREGEQE